MRTFVTILSSVALAASSYAAGTDAADAAQSRNMEALRSLIKQHANVNAAQPDGTTALHWAAHWNDLDAVKLLLQSGADAKAANRYGSTPLSGSRGFGQRGDDRNAAQGRRGCQDLDDARR